MLKKCDLKP